jgi:type II secretory pathway component PulF
MNRNCSYALGILAQKAPDQFKNYLNPAMQAVKNMHSLSDAQDAKDNCVATLVRILEQY